MALAPEISAFGDGAHSAGSTGLTVDGGGFGAFPGELWIYENADRSGASDQLTVGTWNDIELSSVEIPGTLSNSSGTRYLFLLREDLAWSNAFEFTLEFDSIPDFIIDGEGTKATYRQRRMFVEIQGRFVEVFTEKEAIQLLVNVEPAPVLRNPPEKVPNEPMPTTTITMPKVKSSFNGLPVDTGMRRLARRA